MIAIIDYGTGNIRSVQNALSRLGRESLITADHDEIRNCEYVILPGVGDARWAMNSIQEQGLDRLILSLTQPVLGICLGLQLMCRSSEEGDTSCLGIFEAKVKRFPPAGIVPHMGWNDLRGTEGPLFKDLPDSGDMYFVHNYYAEVCKDTIAICDYLLPFSAAMRCDNFYATQFHLEKSSIIGQRLLQNFIEL